MPDADEIDYSLFDLATTADLFAAGTVIMIISGGEFMRATRALFDHRDLNNQVGTTYTLVLTDASKCVVLTNAGAITLTVPLNSSVAFAVGDVIELVRGGAGQITVVGAGGVTVNFCATNRDNFTGQWAVCWLRKIATDTWIFYGDTSAT